MENKPNRIIVHHDGVSRAGDSFAIVNEYHRGRDFPLSRLGFYCGYHLWIERDGETIRAREDNEEGAHCIGENFRSIGIGLAGNFDVEKPTDAQVESLGRVLSYYCGKYRIIATEIYPHRHFAKKTCYGATLDDKWAAVLYLRYELARLTEVLAMLSAPAPQK